MKEKMFKAINCFTAEDRIKIEARLVSCGYKYISRTWRKYPHAFGICFIDMIDGNFTYYEVKPACIDDFDVEWYIDVDRLIKDISPLETPNFIGSPLKDEPVDLKSFIVTIEGIQYNESLNNSHLDTFQVKAVSESEALGIGIEYFSQAHPEGYAINMYIVESLEEIQTISEKDIEQDIKNQHNSSL